jgi:hypothetical protein
MFTTSSIKPSIFDNYNTVQTNFTNIKNLSSFTSYGMIQPNDLIGISNITMDCIDKLGDISALLTKKVNDPSVSVVTNEQLQKMQELHKELIDKISDFNLISLDMYNNLKNPGQTPDIINYMHFDLINRYKFIIMQILETIKRINVYVSLVKDKLN